MHDESAAHTRFAAETWLRKNGLPLLVHPRHRATHLLGRAAPLLTAWFGFSLGYGLIISVLNASLADGTLNADVLIDAADESNVEAQNQALEQLGIMVVIGAIIVLTILVVVPLLVLLVTWGIGRAIGPSMARRRWWGLAAVILNLAVTPWLLTFDGELSLGQAWLLQLAVVAGLFVVIASGLGAFLVWALKSAFQQLSALRLMTSIALPLLILVVIFAFFSAEPWEMSAHLARGRMFWLLAFLGASGLFFITYLARQELKEATTDLKDSESRKLLEGTPLAAIDADETADIQRLNRIQRFNVWAVLVMAQVFQAFFFGIVAFLFMLALTGLSMDGELIKSWSKVDANPMEIFGIKLPIDVTAIRVCAFLAGIAALNFVVTTASNSDYRDAFYDPLMARIRKALAVHAIYEHRLAGAQGKNDGDAQVIAEGIAGLFTSGKAKRPAPRVRRRTQVTAGKDENVGGE